jgi:biotin carboxylase
MKRVLLLLPTTGYRNDDFLAAAKKLDVEIVAAANYCHKLAPSWNMSAIMALHFDRPEQAADTVLREIRGTLDAVLAVDDSGVELAALLAERLGLPGNSAHAVRRVHDKLAFRRLLQEGGFLCPEFHHLPSGADPRELLSHENFQIGDNSANSRHALSPSPSPVSGRGWPTGRERGSSVMNYGYSNKLKFPVVVKARRLSGSRGVIRADDADALVRAVNRVRAIQARADRDAEALGIIIENFIPGNEYALEGALNFGTLSTLALFDKPDPLDGPYFEETLYVTPSRLPAALQERIQQEIANVCRAAGLGAGPIHAEVRVNDCGIWILEVAARSIGGLCGRVLTHSLGMSLEEMTLRALVAQPATKPRANAGEEGGAAGVMMIPIPRRGIYHEVEGLAAAQSIPGVTGVNITAEPGQIIAPPPDGSSYLGFIFTRAANPADAETALRSAHRQLHFDIRPEYPAEQVRSTENQ